MENLLRQRLFWRLLALVIMTLCLSILTLSGVKAPPGKPGPSYVRTQAPTVSVETQPGAPLVISSPRVVSWNGNNVETAFELINVSRTPIRAYAIKQQDIVGTAHKGTVSLHMLGLTMPELGSNQLVTNFETYEFSSEKEKNVTLLVDYVEFTDGRIWGDDSAKSGETSAGQRAALQVLANRLVKILDAGTPTDVLNAVESGSTNIEPPPGRSDQWKMGFRLGCKSMTGHLKRIHTKGGLANVDRELRQLDKRLKKGGK
jgi:hypothetical protein